MTHGATLNSPAPSEQSAAQVLHRSKLLGSRESSEGRKTWFEYSADRVTESRQSEAQQVLSR